MQQYETQSFLTCSTTLLSPSSGSVPFTERDSALNSNTPWASSEASIVTRIWDAIPKLAVKWELQNGLFLPLMFSYMKESSWRNMLQKYKREYEVSVLFIFGVFFSFFKCMVTPCMEKELTFGKAILSVLLWNYATKNSIILREEPK